MRFVAIMIRGQRCTQIPGRIGTKGAFSRMNTRLRGPRRDQNSTNAQIFITKRRRSGTRPDFERAIPGPMHTRRRKHRRILFRQGPSVGWIRSLPPSILSFSPTRHLARTARKAFAAL